MCDPMTIAGVALSGASALANSSAASSAASARNKALAAERERQAGLDAEMNALNATSRDRYVNFEGQQEAKGQALGDYFKGQAQPQDEVNASAALPRSNSGLVVAEENRARGEAREFTNQQGEALGELRSFGDLLGGISRLQARDAASVEQLGGFKKGSSSILPYELDAASQKGAGAKMLGDILGGAGSIATNAGINGGSMGSIFTGSGNVGSGFNGLRTVGAGLAPAQKPGIFGLSLGSPFGG